MRLPDPWGRSHDVPYRRVGDHAVVESALVIGHRPTGIADRAAALAASSAPLGELLVHLAESGCTSATVGVGGTATSDGGLGCFLAAEHTPLRLLAAVDVAVPFASAIDFATQKGVDDADLEALAEELRGALATIEGRSGRRVADLHGAGAGGGVGGALAGLGASLTLGFDEVSRTVGLTESITRADLVVTGEGLLDAGSFAGKVVGGVLAASVGPTAVLVVCGRATEDARRSLAPFGRRVHLLDLTEHVGEHAALTDTAAQLQSAIGTWRTSLR